MANVTRVAGASMDASTGMFAPQISGDLYAGEALNAVAPCRIHTDGKVYMSNGTANNASAGFDGFTPKAYTIGEPVTLFGVGARFRYGSGMTPDTDLYVSGTAGLLSDTATTGGLVAIARTVSSTDIRVIVNAA